MVDFRAQRSIMIHGDPSKVLSDRDLIIGIEIGVPVNHKGPNQSAIRIAL